MVTQAQRRVIDAIVSIHETGRVPGPEAYSTVTILKDGAGISYGKHQATDRSDSLDAVVMRYLDLGGVQADALRPFLGDLDGDLSSTSPTSTRVTSLMSILKVAGLDPLMRRAQDEVFDELYWRPAEGRCQSMRLVLPLSYLAVYDCAIHSGPGRVDSLRRRFAARPPAGGGTEEAWTEAFIQARRAWLLESSNPLVRKTIYRCDGLLGLIKAGSWQLQTPMTYRGVKVA